MEIAMLSVIIPSYKDPCLHQTIDSLLEFPNADVEIVPVIDGYELEKPLRDDPRIKPVYLANNVGMREAINIGVEQSSGEYIMRTDEHCKFGYGYADILTRSIKDNWIVTPRRYKLAIDTWKRTKDKPYDHEKLIISEKYNKFHGVKWKSRDRKRLSVPISEKTAMQGSCWVMTRKWWDKVIGRLQSEGYGTHYQDSVEMSFKTWQAGGKLMVNKLTWHAHKHRDFPRTHSYPVSKARPGWDYALNKWRGYYEDVIVPKQKEMG
jgi:glycosyltransferase involved in cell wall biosynthesis